MLRAIVIASILLLRLASSQSPFQSLYWNVNQSQLVTVGGKKIAVELLDIGAQHDHVRSLIREAWVRS